MTSVASTMGPLRFDSTAGFDEAELAAVAFFARCMGRTRDAYKHDSLVFFQWASAIGLRVMQATRIHIELYRTSMEDRGLAASTIDRVPVDCMRLRPIRAYRPPHRRQPGPVRTSSRSPPARRPRDGSR